MRRIWHFLAALVLALGVTLGSAPAALAEDTPSSWRITKYHANVKVSEDGTANVTATLDFDFGNEAGRGPYIVIPKRQRVLNDPDRWRDLEVRFNSASSPSGADATVYTEQNDDALLVRLGREGRRFTGVQTYTVTYSQRGLISPKNATSGLDEFNWNVIGQGWEVPISNITATVEGPNTVGRVECWTGSNYSTRCEATSSGRTSSFAQNSVGKGVGVQVVAGFPPGTFVGAEPTFSKRMHVGNMFPLTPLTGAATGAVGIGAFALLWSKLRRKTRDEVYLGLAPGMTPARGETGTVGFAKVKAPVAVQFQPPKDSSPGEIGTLLDTKADNVDVTATIIDLAVRGYLQIVPHSSGNEDKTRFVRLDRSDGLRDFEGKLLKNLFIGGDDVSLKRMKKEDYAKLLPDARDGLYQSVVGRGWFKKNPQHAKAAGVASGIGIAILGALVSAGGSLFGFGLLGLPVILAGLATVGVSGRFATRTAKGSAVLAQARGFELYLSTAEAEQIKFEEGIDVFSRYLPYAIVFGVADRWVKVFKDLEQAGIYTADTSWYGGTQFYMFNAYAFSSAMDGLTASMSSAMTSAQMTAATSGSGGGSGFSGGGGFGGGGGGGW